MQWKEGIMGVYKLNRVQLSMYRETGGNCANTWRGAGGMLCELGYIEWSINVLTGAVGWDCSRVLSRPTTLGLFESE